MHKAAVVSVVLQCQLHRPVLLGRMNTPSKQSSCGSQCMIRLDRRLLSHWAVLYQLGRSVQSYTALKAMLMHFEGTPCQKCTAYNLMQLLASMPGCMFQGCMVLVHVIQTGSSSRPCKACSQWDLENKVISLYEENNVDCLWILLNEKWFYNSKDPCTYKFYKIWEVEGIFSIMYKIQNKSVMTAGQNLKSIWFIQ